MEIKVFATRFSTADQTYQRSLEAVSFEVVHVLDLIFEYMFTATVVEAFLWLLAGLVMRQGFNVEVCLETVLTSESEIFKLSLMR